MFAALSVHVAVQSWTSACHWECVSARVVVSLWHTQHACAGLCATQTLSPADLQGSARAHLGLTRPNPVGCTQRSGTVLNSGSAPPTAHFPLSLHAPITPCHLLTVLCAFASNTLAGVLRRAHCGSSTLPSSSRAHRGALPVMSSAATHCNAGSNQQQTAIAAAAHSPRALRTEMGESLGA